MDKKQIRLRLSSEVEMCLHNKAQNMGINFCSLTSVILNRAVYWATKHDKNKISEFIMSPVLDEKNSPKWRKTKVVYVNVRVSNAVLEDFLEKVVKPAGVKNANKGIVILLYAVHRFGFEFMHQVGAKQIV
jgi:hypothetical protein